MKIYTSYFRNLKVVEKEGLLPVSIALYPPIFYRTKKYPIYKTLAPTPDTLNLEWSAYVIEFQKKTLDKLDPQKVFNQLHELSWSNDDKDLCLLCFETTNEQCHRRLVAQWLSTNLNITVEELQ